MHPTLSAWKVSQRLCVLRVMITKYTYYVTQNILRTFPHIIQSRIWAVTKSFNKSFMFPEWVEPGYAIDLKATRSYAFVATNLGRSTTDTPCTIQIKLLLTLNIKGEILFSVHYQKDRSPEIVTFHARCKKKKKKIIS